MHSSCDLVPKVACSERPATSREVLRDPAVDVQAHMSIELVARSPEKVCVVPLRHE